eukprot:2179228-Amphidinium_carterae.1
MPQQQPINRLDNTQLYETGSFQTAINKINARISRTSIMRTCKGSTSLHRQPFLLSNFKATVFDGLYDYVDYTPDFVTWYYNYDECDSNDKVYGLLQDDAPGLPVYADNIIGDKSQQEANIPRTLKTPTLPSQQEIDEHNLTHLPYRDWCKHCVQGKSRSQHHQRRGLTKQSITQVDDAFLKSDNDKHNSTVLTMCESTTGLGYATVVPYKGINARTQSNHKIHR